MAVISDKAVLQASQSDAGNDEVRSLCEVLLRSIIGFEVVWIIIDCQAAVAESDKMTTGRLRGRSGRRSMSLGRLQRWLHQIKAASHIEFHFRYLCSCALGTLVLILEEAIAASAARFVATRKRATPVPSSEVGERRNIRGNQEPGISITWRSRRFLREAESDKERFMCTIPGINNFTAQMLLDECTFVEMLHWPDSDLDSVQEAIPAVPRVTISGIRKALT